MGRRVGFRRDVGAEEGAFEGWKVGRRVDPAVGPDEGSRVLIGDGAYVGLSVVSADGSADGVNVAGIVGANEEEVGTFVLSIVVGLEDGTRDGGNVDVDVREVDREVGPADGTVVVAEDGVEEGADDDTVRLVGADDVLVNDVGPEEVVKVDKVVGAADGADDVENIVGPAVVADVNAAVGPTDGANVKLREVGAALGSSENTVGVEVGAVLVTEVGENDGSTDDKD